MILMQPKSMIFLGLFLVLTGFVLPFLMVLHLMETTYFLSFISWISTTAGLILGVIGAAQYVRIRKK